MNAADVVGPSDDSPRDRISNHLAAKLSDLDMRMVVSIPEGGNWKDIPLSVPSKRLDQIRESFSRGEGSRSTYYGRLQRSDPSYTISTYFSRPGNGCHIHYSQDRVLTPREAARLQSFPDSFEFTGSQSSVGTQIGNAVPPLIAFQLARTLGRPGLFIDLFAGAGGMGLGFTWAGWKPVIANDISATFLSTYAQNVHSRVVVGSISDAEVFGELVKSARQATRQGKPVWVLGGPPCQGFSTAGNQRSMDDPRNHLAWDYVRFLAEVQPDGFLFENVTGLLNMDGGRIFAAMKEAFASVMPNVTHTIVASERFGVPQRRKRVILVGSRDFQWLAPTPMTSMDGGALPRSVSVFEALDDLPILGQSEDGRGMPYRHTPTSSYQKLMRGVLSPPQYLRDLRNGTDH